MNHFNKTKRTYFLRMISNKWQWGRWLQVHSKTQHEYSTVCIRDWSYFWFDCCFVMWSWQEMVFFGFCFHLIIRRKYICLTRRQRMNHWQLNVWLQHINYTLEQAIVTLRIQGCKSSVDLYTTQSITDFLKATYKVRTDLWVGSSDKLITRQAECIITQAKRIQVIGQTCWDTKKGKNFLTLREKLRFFS